MKQKPMQPQSSLPRFCTRRNPSRAHSAGFTLLEMVICIIIIGIVFSYAGMTIAAYVQKDQAQRTNAQILQSGEYALTNITRNLAFHCNSITLASDTYLIYQYGTQKQYVIYSPTSLPPLISENKQLLLPNVPQFSLTYLDQSGQPIADPQSNKDLIRYVTVSFTVSKDNISQTFTQTVFLRALNQ